MSARIVPDRPQRQVPVLLWLLSSLCLAFIVGYAQPARSAGITVDIQVNASLAVTISEEQGDLLTCTTGEVLAVLDWHMAIDYSTPEVAGSVVSELVESAYAELPIHLIGHSRGGSLVAEMARLLGEQGIWVDHVTTLDPHPAENTLLPPYFVDAGVYTYENTLFADNIWRFDECDIMKDDDDCTFDFDGQPIAGAYNRELTEFDEDGGTVDLGYPEEHSDVHLWYHGTIDLDDSAFDGEQSITQDMRETWWTEIEAEGVNAGFVYSRLVGGDRLSHEVPAGGDRIVDGYSEESSLGGNGLRVDLNMSNAVWPNIIRFDVAFGGDSLVPGADVVTVGDVLDLNYAYQDYDSTSHVAVYLDNDRNPYNGVGESVYAGDHDVAGDAVLYESAPWDTTDMVPGTETYILAVIDDGSHTRCMYAAQSLVFEEPSDDSYEENDMLDEAYDLSGYENTWSYMIDGSGIQADDDWYEILVSDCHERVIVECHFTHNDGNIDLVLYDSAGSPVWAAESDDDNEYMDVTLAEAGTCYVQVRGDNAGNTYDLWWQNMARVPDPPTNVQATDGTYTSKVEISWSGALCAAEYRVYRNTTDDPGSATALGSWQPSLAFTDYSTQAETTYFYWVQSRTESGTSGFSQPDTGWREVPAPLDYEPDVDGSNSVDAVDVQLVINAALGLDVEYPCDLDGSDSVDAVDIQLVINAVLGVGY